MGITTKEYHEGYQQGYKEAKEEIAYGVTADKICLDLKYKMKGNNNDNK